jgi:hypothetical protein
VPVNDNFRVNSTLVEVPNDSSTEEKLQNDVEWTSMSNYEGLDPRFRYNLPSQKEYFSAKAFEGLRSRVRLIWSISSSLKIIEDMTMAQLEHLSRQVFDNERVIWISQTYIPKEHILALNHSYSDMSSVCNTKIDKIEHISVSANAAPSAKDAINVSSVGYDLVSDEPIGDSIVAKELLLTQLQISNLA